MITRIVKLHFQANFCKAFENNFPEFKKVVTSFDGCKGVKLMKSSTIGVYFTISQWEQENKLDQYRTSEAFKKIWNTLKPNFESRAEAWTTEEI